jgi:Rrf2 family transcriptional regulator, iron-sulfur cluster assembly transcription factor
MITKKAEYAIIILTELASHPKGTTVTSREIAARRSIPANLVVQLLSILNEAGWTSGTRGPAGGIKLIDDPSKISLREVIEKVDGPIGITRCLFSDTPCQDKTHCSLRGIWSRAQQGMLDVLENATIEALVKSPASGCL